MWEIHWKADRNWHKENAMNKVKIFKIMVALEKIAEYWRKMSMFFLAPFACYIFSEYVQQQSPFFILSCITVFCEAFDSIVQNPPTVYGECGIEKCRKCAWNRYIWKSAVHNFVYAFEARDFFKWLTSDRMCTGSLQVAMPLSHCVSSTCRRSNRVLSICLKSVFSKFVCLRTCWNTGSAQLYRFRFIVRLGAQSGLIEFAEIPAKLIFKRLQLNRSDRKKAEIWKPHWSEPNKKKMYEVADSANINNKLIRIEQKTRSIFVRFSICLCVCVAVCELNNMLPAINVLQTWSLLLSLSLFSSAALPFRAFPDIIKMLSC